MSLVQKQQKKIWFNNRDKKQMASTEVGPSYDNGMKWWHVRDHLHVSNASNCMCEGQHIIFTQCDKQVYNGATALSRWSQSLKLQYLKS